MSKFLKKAQKIFYVFVALCTVFWSAGLGFVKIEVPEAKAASVAVQFQGAYCDPNMPGGCNSTQPMFEIPYSGSILPASSQPAGLFSFKLKRTATATLTNIKVNLVGTASASDIASIALYKRASFSGGGMGYNFPETDRIGNQTTINVFSSGTSSNNTIIVDPTKNAIGTSFEGVQYYVAISTAAGWSGTDNVSYNLSLDWITVSDGALGSACASNASEGKNYCQPATDKYFGGSGGGFGGMSFGVENIEYMGVKGDGTKEVSVRFTNDVNTTSATTAANYAISGTAPTSVKSMTPHSVSLIFASNVTITSNQTHLIIKGPLGASVNGKNGVQDMMGSVLNPDIDMVIMGSAGGAGGAPLLISEVMIGRTGEPLKEFIELYNPSTIAVNFTNMGIKLWVTNASTTTTVGHTKVKDIISGSIPGNGYFLIASSQYSAADYSGVSVDTSADYDASLGGAEGRLQANRGVYISTSDTSGVGIIDKLGWGTATPDMSQGPAKCSSSELPACAVANDGKSLERKANPQATATSMMLTDPNTDGKYGNTYMSGNNQYDFIQRVTAQPQKSTSDIEAPGGAGFGISNTPPHIFHQPLFMGLTSTDLIVMADIGDDSGDLAASNTKLFYRDHTPPGAYQEITGVKMSPGKYKFTILSSALNATADLDYYLRATDGTKYTCMPVNCVMEGAGAGNLSGGTPILVDITSTTATNNIISGFVRDTLGNGINAVMVFLDGSPYTTTTNSSGAWTLSGMPSGIYRVRASGGSYTTSGTTKNYTDGWLEGISVNSNNTSSSNNTIVLTEGMGGMGGDRETPMVMWSAPHDQMMGAPTRIDIKGLNQIEAPIMLGFSKAMDSTTINTTNIKLKSVSAAGVLTEVSGTCVIYQTQGAEATLGSGACARSGVSSVNFGPDQKAIIYSATPLTPNTPYGIELTGAVKDTAGNPLQGARPGGGHIISFTTNAGDFGGMSGGTAINTIFVDKYGATQQFGTTQAQVTNFASGGDMMPPYVMATMPSPGARNVFKDTNLVITFSEPMDPSTITTNTIKLYDINYNNTHTGQYINLSASDITLDSTKTIATINPPTDLSATDRNYAIRVLGGTRSAKGIYITKPDAGYETRTMHQTDFEVGTSSDTVNPTVQGTNLQMYEVSGSITGVPNSIGVIDIGFSEDMDPGTINTSTITLKSGTNNVAATISYDTSSRSARVIPSSVLYTNTQYTLTVESGSSGVKAINGADAYKVIASDYTQNFTTSSNIDTEAPRINFANGDDFRLAITFSESMKAASAVDTANWANSVLNPANYILYTDNNPPTSGDTALYFSKANLSQVTDSATGGPLSFKYDAPTFTVVIEGLRLLQPAIHGGFRIFTRNIKDLSGNVIRDNSADTSSIWTPTLTDGKPNTFGPNAAGGGVMNSATSFGNIGPGGGGMMGPPTAAMMAGGAGAGKGMVGGMNQAQDFGGKNVHNMGFKPIGAFPMNMQAGATSMYMIDIPLEQALAAGDKIVLTFPQGFNVAGAKSGDPNNKFAHQDLNGPGPGIVRLKTNSTDDEAADTATKGGLAADGVVVNTQARNVTLYLNVTGVTPAQTGANDFLHFEVDGIVNSQTAKDFNTAGYTVDIKTVKVQDGADVRTLESKTSMPFFLQPKGSISLNVTVNFKNSAGSAASVTQTDVRVFLMSPMSGPLKQAADWTNESTKTYSFTGLNAGMYQLMTEPMVSIGSTDYYSDRGDPRPFDIAASNQNCASSTCTAAINLQAETTTNRPQVTVYLIGAFATDDIDIFAGGPGGFRVKTVNDLTATCVTGAEAGCSYTLSLPGTGKFMIGMGPAMPKGPETMGPPPMPNWMPPRPQDVSVSGSAGSWTWADSDGAATADTSATDGKITIDISNSTANKTITGFVCKTLNALGTACATDGYIANVEVAAFSPMGGFGSHASSNSSDGSFSLAVKEGFYKVSAFIPGRPPSRETSVDVRGSSLYVDGVLATRVVLKVQVPDYTISGIVSDGSNVVKGANVFAYHVNAQGQPDGRGYADATTDSTGKYIVYVDPGTWKVGGFIPGYGQLPLASELSVTISAESATNQNLNPPTTSNTFSFITIEDRIFKNVDGIAGYNASSTDVALAGVHVVVEGTNYVNDAMTDANGIYSIKVPTDPSGANLANYTYDIKAWSPTLGKLPTVENFSSATTTSVDGAAKITVPDTKTVTVNFVDSLGAPVILSEAFIQLDKVGAKDISNDAKVSNKSSVSLEVPIDVSCNTATGANCYALDIDIPGISEQALAADKVNGAAGTTIIDQDIDSARVGTEMYLVKVDGAGGNGNEIINVVVPTLYTVSGVVKDAANNTISDAVVHIEQPGTEIEMEVKTDSNGAYTAQLPASGSTPYLIKSDKVGYMDTAGSLAVTANNSAANLTVDAATSTISGQIKVGSTGVEKATVMIEQLGGGFTTAQTDADGNYTAKVPYGDYKVSAVAQGYTEQNYKSGAQVAVVSTSATNTAVTSKDVTLSTEKTNLSTPAPEAVTPQNGGAIEHTSSTGLGIDLPPGSLGSSSSDYRVSDKDTSNIPLSTPTANIVGGEAKEIMASYQTSTASQVPVEKLEADMGIEMTYTKAELTTAGLDTFAEVENMKAGYFDDTARNWASIPTNITYLGSSDQAVIPTSTLSNVSKVLIAGKTDHLTIFGSYGGTADGLAPKAPSPVTATGGASSIVITWTAPTQNADNTSLTDLVGYEIYRSTSANDGYVQLNTIDILTTSYTDSTAVSGTTYYYKVTAMDGHIESVMSSSSSASLTTTTPPSGSGSIPPSMLDSQKPTAKTPTVQEPAPTAEKSTAPAIKVSRIQQLANIVSEAKRLAKAAVAEILELLGAKRDLKQEQTVAGGLAKQIIGNLKATTEIRNALVNFITYGTPESLKLGSGERAGVVNSFKSAFGKLPQTETDWQDVIKIGAGRWPSQKSETKEKTALKTFEKIYQHQADRKNPKEDAAVVIMAYGLRPSARNLNSEKSAILSFKKIFGKQPTTADNWDTVRAVAYSGASRQTTGKVLGVSVESLHATTLQQQKKTTVSAVFNQNLGLGSSGLDVSRLQELLSSDPEVYPEGTISGYFGPKTEKAVGRFQIKHQIVFQASDPGFGYLGPITRAKIAEVFGK